MKIINKFKFGIKEVLVMKINSLKIIFCVFALSGFFVNPVNAADLKQVLHSQLPLGKVQIS